MVKEHNNSIYQLVIEESGGLSAAEFRLLLREEKRGQQRNLAIPNHTCHWHKNLFIKLSI